jgi:hypothetical protein
MAIPFDSDWGSLDRRRRHHDRSNLPINCRLRRVGDKKMTSLLMRLSFWNWIPYAIIAGWLGWVAYDEFVPVVRMQGELVSRTENAVVVRMWGEKVRDCRFVGIQGFSRVGDGINRDMRIKRIDLESVGETKPRGHFDIGHWQLHPLDGATHVVVWVQHSCRQGDLRNTRIAEVAL